MSDRTVGTVPMARPAMGDKQPEKKVATDFVV